MDQITKIKLVEEGIQAKADTKVVISISCSDDEYDVKHEPIVVQYDRPFIYMLRNKKTNSIIMAGIYAEPEEWDYFNKCAHGRRDYVFVASGGAAGLSLHPEMMDDRTYRLHFIRGRRLILVPDADMVGSWQQDSAKLLPYARSVKVVDVRRPPFSLTGSDDIGDYVFRLPDG